MPQLIVDLKGDGAWPDLQVLEEEENLIVVPHEAVIEIATLDEGMISGEPSLAWHCFSRLLPQSKESIPTSFTFEFVEVTEA